MCSLLGRSKYQLFLGFVPLCTAISGNVGLQASVATRNAVMHGLVNHRESYRKWIIQEFGAACYLGLVLGTFIGIAAFLLSDHSAFALTIALSQFVSILSGGLTGTLAPLLCTHKFKINAQKWEGPLVTATQDLIGAFTMFIISYKLLQFLGPFHADPMDSCQAA